MATVVRIQRVNGEVVQDCDVYIGRACSRGGWNLNQSKWHNPFKFDTHGEDTLALYEQHVRNSGLINDIEELRGKRIGCWCVPHKKCHGEILVKILNEKLPIRRILRLNVIR